jgi:Circularly permutated YpsA SLOG family
LLAKIISGGQTGVDRAALDVAQELGIPCGGWCPKGRRAEDGTIAAKYPLTETPSEKYPQRTEWNVREADGTLVLTRGQPQGGTALTIAFANRQTKPLLVLDLSQMHEPARVGHWIATQHIHVLNIAGPRESENDGIYTQAKEFLRQALPATASGETP